MPLYPHLGAFESVNIHGSDQDVLRTTRHDELWRADLEMLAAAGIRELRYPVPWHRIEKQLDVWDWRWIDGPMCLMRQLGMQPILDPLHHVSFPAWLEDGFANSEFPRLYARFIAHVCQRYPWVDRYTVFNEPMPTLALCSFAGKWYPYHQSDRSFVTMAANTARAICLASAELRKSNPQIKLVQIDSCEHHRPLDSQAEQWVQHINERRFLFHDVALGKLDKHHLLIPYLEENGLRRDEVAWLAEHAVPFDIIGLDYYAHSEMEWRWDKESNGPVNRFPCHEPRGFAAVAGDYTARYDLPVMLSETNVGGTVTDRITWLKFMEEQSEILASHANFVGFCWFPSIDATDWNSLCTRADNITSPMGIWSLAEETRNRCPSDLSDWYIRLANGKATSADLPAYRLLPPLDHDLHGFWGLTSDWKWLEP